MYMKNPKEALANHIYPEIEEMLNKVLLISRLLQLR